MGVQGPEARRCAREARALRRGAGCSGAADAVAAAGERLALEAAGALVLAGGADEADGAGAGEGGEVARAVAGAVVAVVEGALWGDCARAGLVTVGGSRGLGCAGQRGNIPPTKSGNFDAQRHLAKTVVVQVKLSHTTGTQTL